MSFVKSRWGQLLLVLVFGALLWGGEYVRRGFWEPDEARYAYVASEMRATGQWFVPHRYGEFYAHKPPLFFWLQNAASSLSGGVITPVTARLPAFAGMMLTLWMTFCFAERRAGREAAWRSVIVLGSSFLVWQEGGMGRMDSVLMGLETAAIFLLFENDRAPARWRLALAYACIGLAIVAKGPVGLVVPVGVYATCRWACDGWRAAFPKHLLWGIPLALLIPLVWLALAWHEGGSPEYFHELFFKQSIDRLTGEGGFGKPRPFYFFLIHFPGEFMPWTLFLPAAWLAMGADEGKRRLRRQLLAWAAFVIVFFSLSTGKRQLYILAAYPAAAMLVGIAWEGLASIRRDVFLRTRYLAVGIVFLLGLAELAFVVVVSLPSIQHELALMGKAGAGLLKAMVKFQDQGISPLVFVPSAVVALSGALFLSFWKRNDVRRFFDAFAGVILLYLICISNIIYPALNAVKTPAAQVEGINRCAEPGDPLYMYQIDSEIVPLYCGRLGQRLPDERALMTLVSDGRRRVVVFTGETWKKLEPQIQNEHLAFVFPTGSKTLTWVAFGHQEKAH